MVAWSQTEESKRKEVGEYPTNVAFLSKRSRSIELEVLVFADVWTIFWMTYGTVCRSNLLTLASVVYLMDVGS
jgi:hypothetical protein